MGTKGNSRNRSKKPRSKSMKSRKSKNKKKNNSRHRKNSPVGRGGSNGIPDEFYSSKSKKICVLRHGESMLLSKNTYELEIILYRPLEPPELHTSSVCETPGDDVVPRSPLVLLKHPKGQLSSVPSDDGVRVQQREGEGNGFSTSCSGPQSLLTVTSREFNKQIRKKASRSNSGTESEDVALSEDNATAKRKNRRSHTSTKVSGFDLPLQHFGMSMPTPGARPEGADSTSNSPRGTDLGSSSYRRWDSTAPPIDKAIVGSEADPQLQDCSSAIHVSNANKKNDVNDGENRIVSTATYPSHPLFFDTTACVFVDPKNLRKANYVATGRSTTDHKDMVHISHAVVTGKELPSPWFYTRLNINVSQSEPTISERQIELMMSFGAVEESEVESWISSKRTPLTFAPLASVNGPVMMAAADGVRLHLKHLQQAAGALVSCSLFENNNAQLPPDWGVYFLVRAKGPSTSICLIPILAFQGKETSQISIMLRQIRVENEYVWELISMAEFLPCCDVPGVLLAMQKRGLADVTNYNPDYRSIRGESEGSSDRDSLSESSEVVEEELKEEEEEEVDKLEPGLKTVQELSATKIGRSTSLQGDASERVTPGGASSSGAPAPFAFEELLAKLPLVMREGRRQYSEGFTNVNSMLDEDAFSGEDEVMEDALKAAVPHFAHGHPIRYADGTYNNGSHPTALSFHYTTYRAKYAVEQASGAPSSGQLFDRGSNLNPPLNADVIRLQRLEDEEEALLPPPWEAVLRGTSTPLAGSRQSITSSSTLSKKKRRKSRSSSRGKSKKKGKRRKSNKRRRSRKRKSDH